VNPVYRRFESAVVFVVALLGVLVIRREAFSLPFYWDEIGLYGPYAWAFNQNLFAPDTTLIAPTYFWFHTPLYFWLTGAITRILGWKLEVIRMIGFIAAAAFVAGTYSLGRVWAGKASSALAATALALSPVVLSQAGFLQPDLPMAALLAFSLAAMLRGRLPSAGMLFAAGVLVKGTAIVLLPAWVLILLTSRRQPRAVLTLVVPALAALAAWWLVFRSIATPALIPTADTGIFLNNLGLTGVKRVAQRLVQWGGLDGRWLWSVAIALAGGVLIRRHRSLVRWIFPLVVISGSLILFLSLFGFMHERYVLVALPILAAFGARAIDELVLPGRRSEIGIHLAVSLAIAVQGWLSWISPPGRLSGWEYHSGYADHVKITSRLTIEAVRHAESHRAMASAHPVTVATVWPITHALERPFLFYTNHRVDVVDLRDPATTQANATLASAFALIVDGRELPPQALELLETPAMAALLGSCRDFSAGAFTGRFCAGQE